MSDTTSFSAGRQFRSGRVTIQPQVELLNALNRVDVIAANSAFVSAGRATRADTGRQIECGLDVRF